MGLLTISVPVKTVHIIVCCVLIKVLIVWNVKEPIDEIIRLHVNTLYLSIKLRKC